MTPLFAAVPPRRMLVAEALPFDLEGGLRAPVRVAEARLEESLERELESLLLRERVVCKLDLEAGEVETRWGAKGLAACSVGVGCGRGEVEGQWRCWRRGEGNWSEAEATMQPELEGWLMSIICLESGGLETTRRRRRREEGGGGRRRKW